MIKDQHVGSSTPATFRVGPLATLYFAPVQSVSTQFLRFVVWMSGAARQTLQHFIAMLCPHLLTSGNNFLSRHFCMLIPFGVFVAQKFTFATLGNLAANRWVVSSSPEWIDFASKINTKTCFRACFNRSSLNLRWQSVKLLFAHKTVKPYARFCARIASGHKLTFHSNSGLHITMRQRIKECEDALERSRHLQLEVNADLKLMEQGKKELAATEERLKRMKKERGWID